MAPYRDDLQALEAHALLAATRATTVTFRPGGDTARATVGPWSER